MHLGKITQGASGWGKTHEKAKLSANLGGEKKSMGKGEGDLLRGLHVAANTGAAETTKAKGGDGSGELAFKPEGGKVDHT